MLLKCVLWLGIVTIGVLNAECARSPVPQEAASRVVGALTDGQPAEAPLDIVAAEIVQYGGTLTFLIQTDGDIPAELAGGDSLVYLWLVDTDSDATTGQPHSGLGSEFNVRAVFGSGGGGFVDVTGAVEGGGTATVSTGAREVQVTVGLAQLGNPKSFRWSVDSFGTRAGVRVPGNGESAVAIASLLPYRAVASACVVPPLLMLSPAGTASGRVTLEIRDPEGQLLCPKDHRVEFRSTNEGVATVDESGFVTVRGVPAVFGDTPVIEASVDGLAASNATVVRSTLANLGLSYSYYAGEHVTFWLPTLVDGVDLGAIAQTYAIVAVTDRAYAAEQALTDSTPFRGATQYFVVDVTPDPNTVPCGISGNPIRLGWQAGKPADNSCFILNHGDDRTPQWSVIFHELGHNFCEASRSFNEFTAVPDSPQNFTYSEGLASLCGMWVLHELRTRPEELPSAAQNSLAAADERLRERFASALAAYRAGGLNYATVNPDVLDGILYELLDRFGPGVWYGIFSTLTPSEPLPISMDSPAKQATWFLAAVVASTGADPHALADEYGFPLDMDWWPGALRGLTHRDRSHLLAFCIQPGPDARGGLLPKICSSRYESPWPGRGVAAAGGGDSR